MESGGGDRLSVSPRQQPETRGQFDMRMVAPAQRCTHYASHGYFWCGVLISENTASVRGHGSLEGSDLFF